MSSESKHTKGPLKVWGQNKLTEVGGFYIIGRRDEIGACLAYVANGDDALLFAAAPELYRELYHQVRNCPLCKGTTKAVDVVAILDGADDAYNEVDCTRCASARGVLAKAEGQS